MEKVLIRPNPTRAKTLHVTANIVSAIKSYGFDVLISEEFRRYLDPAIAQKVTFCDASKAISLCDFAVVIGGDGTILRVAEAAATQQKPVLGINVGTIGFMSELEMQELWEIEKIKEGAYWLDSRMMIDVRVVSPEGETMFSASGLNDAVVSKGIASRVIKLYVYVNDRETLRLSGDGVIVCTPTGSTAYSLSAGGPVIEPSSACLAVTPICAHSLNAKSFVLGSDKEIRIVPPEQDNSVYLSVDGFNSHEVRPGDSIVIKKSSLSLSLIRIKELGFYEVVSKKLSNERVEV